MSFRRKLDLERTLVIGVDVASERHVAFLRGPRGLELGPLSFSNDRSGYQLLGSKVEEARKATGGREVVLALEPTGPYGHTLARWALERGWSVVGVLGAHTSRAKELWGNSPLKSDGKDARVICDLAVEGKWVTFSVREGAYAELKALVVYRGQLVEERTRWKNRIRSVLWAVFPEYLGLMKGKPYGRTSLELLQRYPTPGSYAGTGVEELSERMRGWSRGKLGRERAEALLAAARASVGMEAGLESRSWALRSHVRELERLKGRIGEVEARMERWLEEIPSARSLLSMPQVGVVTAATLLGECGDWGDFPGAREVEKFCGLNLVSASSGKWQGRARISKRGSRRARHQLFLLAGRLVKHGGRWRAHYDRLRERGAARKQALVALSRKALQVLYALVRDRVDYQNDQKGVTAVNRAAA